MHIQVAKYYVHVKYMFTCLTTRLYIMECSTQHTCGLFTHVVSSFKMTRFADMTWSSTRNFPQYSLDTPALWDTLYRLLMMEGENLNQQVKQIATNVSKFYYLSSSVILCFYFQILKKGHQCLFFFPLGTYSFLLSLPPSIHHKQCMYRYHIDITNYRWRWNWDSELPHSSNTSETYYCDKYSLKRRWKDLSWSKTSLHQLVPPAHYSCCISAFQNKHSKWKNSFFSPMPTWVYTNTRQPLIPCQSIH